MIRMRQLAAVAALCAVPVLCLAQAQGPAADKPVPPMKSEAKEEKMAATPTVRRRTAKSRVDARECLKFPTDRELIICAEKFLGRAQAQRPAADKPAPPMKSEAKEEKMAAPPTVRRRTAKSPVDARECLKFPTDRQIIVCAEKFL